MSVLSREQILWRIEKELIVCPNFVKQRFECATAPSDNPKDLEDLAEDPDNKRRNDRYSTKAIVPYGLGDAWYGVRFGKKFDLRPGDMHEAYTLDQALRQILIDTSEVATMIHPGQVLYCETEEHFRMFASHMAYLLSARHLLSIGLMVDAEPMLPGHNGPMKFVIRNVGTEPLIVVAGRGAFDIAFTRVDT